MTLAETLRQQKWYLAGILLLVACLYARIFPDMVMQWYRDENYSHGFFVPVIAAYFLYQRRGELLAETVTPWNPGLAVVLFALLQMAVGFLAYELFTMRSSLVVLLAGLVISFFGRDVFRRVLLPIGYLFLMIPLPYIVYNSIAFPLKLFVTRFSVWFLQAIGIVVMREGTIIMFPATTLEVADACSGMRSLMSLLALAVAYAFLVHRTAGPRIILILAAVPIAIVTNAVRVIVTGILAQYYGSKVAEGFFHEFAGLAVFLVALLLLAGLGALLGDGREEE